MLDEVEHRPPDLSSKRLEVSLPLRHLLYKSKQTTLCVKERELETIEMDCVARRDDDDVVVVVVDDGDGGEM